MFRFALLSICLMFVFAGCTAAGEDTRDHVFGYDAAGRPAKDGQGDERPAPECLPARVTMGVIQLHRVVVTLDRGALEGVRNGMVGVLATGRPLKIISVDHHTSRAVITGINLRIAPGTGACLYIDDR